MTHDDLNARIQKLTQRIVEQGTDIQREVREVALAALRERQTGQAHLQALTSAVIQGVQAALATPPTAPPEQSALAQALRGLEDAVGASAEAMKLALQEAAARTRDVTARDLQRGKEDLKTLQELFVEVVRHTTQDTRRSAHTTWDDFARHVEGNSTRLSAQIADIGAQVQRYLETSARHATTRTTDTLSGTADALANAAADALGKLAEALRRGDAAKKG